MEPGHLFACSLFGAVGVSHVARPRVWKDFVRAMVAMGPGGVALYAALHALPGAVVVGFSGTAGWSGWVLFAVGAALVIKSTAYCLWPERAIKRMNAGLRLPDGYWSLAGGLFLLIAVVAAVGGIR